MWFAKKLFAFRENTAIMFMASAGKKQYKNEKVLCSFTKSKGLNNFFFYVPPAMFFRAVTGLETVQVRKV